MSVLRRMARLLRPVGNRRGSALPGVMVFAVVAFITVSVYLFT